MDDHADEPTGPTAPGAVRIYHLALRDEWAAVRAGEPYRRSTLGASLEEVGFIHCSFARQVRQIADLVYRDRDDVVLLEIDPARVDCELRVEPAHAGAEEFPHVYGPLPTGAVVSVHTVAPDASGRLVLPCLRAT